MGLEIPLCSRGFIGITHALNSSSYEMPPPSLLTVHFDYNSTKLAAVAGRRRAEGQHRADPRTAVEPCSCSVNMALTARLCSGCAGCPRSVGTASGGSGITSRHARSLRPVTTRHFSWWVSPHTVHHYVVHDSIPHNNSL